MIAVTYPQNRKLTAAEDFLMSEYERILSKLDIITGQSMSEASLEASIEVYNRHSNAMTAFAQAANDHLDIITPAVRHAIMKSAHFYEKSEHTAIMENITAELEKLPPYDFKGKRVVLSGITAEPDELLNILEENNMAVVGDELAQE